MTLKNNNNYGTSQVTHQPRDKTNPVLMFGTRSRWTRGLTIAFKWPRHLDFARGNISFDTDMCGE